jgi:ABC-type branched-subunit amino acid transport system substrate-binding protein
MKNSIFIGRREVLELFNLLCNRDPQEQNPLPILSLIGSPGSGKTALIEEMLTRYCMQDGRPKFPYAYIDFTTEGAPTDLFQILVHLRDQLWQHEDTSKRHLIFPRFDLMAVFASAARTAINQPLSSSEDTQRRIKDFISLLGPLGEISNALGNTLNFIPPLWLFLRWAEQEFLQELTQNLKRGSTWSWCKTKLQLPEETPIRDVLQRLSDISKPNTWSRKTLIELLSSAFFDDLHDILDQATPSAWNRTTNVILFLDGFEVLLDNPRNPGLRLLEGLSLSEYRKRGESDPVLVVVGSQYRLFEPVSLPSRLSLEIKDARQRYTLWKHNLPNDKQYLRLEDLSLECTLPDFSPAEVEQYLSQFYYQQTQPLSEKELNPTIMYRVTRGHPLSLFSIVSAIAEAHARARTLSTSNLKQTMVEALSRSEFFNRLPVTEQNALIICAIPRLLDIDILQTILQSQYDIEIQNRWQRYRRLAIFQVLDEDRLVLHPIIRAFLLQQLPPRSTTDSNYYKTHERLRDFFHWQASQGDEHARIEEIYHTLALGDPKPAIAFAITTQEDKTTPLESLIETVSQAPTGLINKKSIEQQAADALRSAKEQHDTRDSITAIVLYAWLLSASDDEILKKAELQHLLALAYTTLALSTSLERDHQNSLLQAITLYRAALDVYTVESSPSEYADINFNLGEAYAYLLDTGVQANPSYLEEAEIHYLEAFETYNRERRDAEAKKTKEKLREIRKWKTTDRIPQLTAQLVSPLERGEETTSSSTTPIMVPSPVGPTSTLPINTRNPLLSLRANAKIKALMLLGIITLLLLVFAASYTPLTTLFLPRHPSAGVVPSSFSLPKSIGVVKAPNGENIGINDGTFPPFDIGPGRSDNSLTQQAAQALKEGQVARAISLWRSAVEIDTNDPEALIYLEDQRVFASGQPYLTLIAGSAFLQPYPDIETLNALQGAYVAQKEYNDSSSEVKIRLLIANSGSDLLNASLVAQQVVNLAKQDKTIVGVLGWLASSRSLSVIPILAKATIPMVSQTASSDELTGFSPYFFRVVPPNKVQGEAAARFAENSLHAKHAVVFVDPSDSYSQSLVEDFVQQFTQDGNTILQREIFTTGKTTNFAALMRNALSYSPDVLYFSGANDNDTSTFLKTLPTSGPFANLPAIGGDAGYVVQPSGYNRWYFTTFAYPDEWSFLRLSKQQPVFFTDYANDFDPNRKHPGYSYTRANATAILSYDATLVLLKGCQIALANGKTSITPQTLAQALMSITGNQTVQGASGQISFGPDHDPINKAIVILRVNIGGFTQIVSVLGCFLKGRC